MQVQPDGHEGSNGYAVIFVEGVIGALCHPICAKPSSSLELFPEPEATSITPLVLNPETEATPNIRSIMMTIGPK
jgi:hypothetical protein